MGWDVALLVADALLAGYRFTRPGHTAPFFDLARADRAYVVSLDDDGCFEFAARWRVGGVADGTVFESLAELRADAHLPN